jgi:hypothetical protein
VVKFPDYFLAFGICLALVASFFFWLTTSAFVCFCTACLLLSLGDLSPMSLKLMSEGTPINSEICAESLAGAGTGARSHNLGAGRALRE